MSSRDIPSSLPWERQLLEKYMFAMHKEAVRDRRYRMALKILRAGIFGLLMMVVFLAGQTGAVFSEKTVLDPHVAYITLNGEIGSGSAVDADKVIPALERAFRNQFSKAIMIRINSPGGSPVQSGRIYEEILRLKSEHSDKKVYAVIGDIGASGGYYIAVAADEIHADQASIVGSIGVISSSFGFTELMERAGVERRMYTAGENKAMLDPFSPVDESTEAFWKSLLGQTHQQFIARVKEGRREKLVDHPQLFSGLVWNGEQALALGLIDGLGSMRTLSREIGVTHLVDYTPRRDFFQTMSKGIVAAVHAFQSATTKVSVY